MDSRVALWAAAPESVSAVSVVLAVLAVLVLAASCS
jgi:hypothetical protein